MKTFHSFIETATSSDIAGLIEKLQLLNDIDITPMIPVLLQLSFARRNNLHINGYEGYFGMGKNSENKLDLICNVMYSYK